MLIAILVMMVVLAFIALAAVSTSIVQERMAGNARDRNVALQAGEAALRDAERDIEANLDASSGFNDACPTGLCVPPSMTTPASVPTPPPIDMPPITQAAITCNSKPAATSVYATA